MAFGDIKKWAGSKLGGPPKPAMGPPPGPPGAPPHAAPPPGAPPPPPPPPKAVPATAPPLFNPAISSQHLPPDQAKWASVTNEPERPDNPPSWVDDEAAWEDAKKAVKKNWGDYDEPWAVVASVYANMTE